MKTPILEELRDSLDGSVLASERDLTTSEQSGETFCYEKDQNVFDEFGRYDLEQDLFPQVRLQRVRDDTGNYLPIVLGGDINRGRPDLETLQYSLNQPEITPNVVAVNHRIVLYSFLAHGRIAGTGASKLFVPGTLRSETDSVAVADMWQHPDGAASLPEWSHFRVRYDANYVGGTFSHSLLASVDPINDVRFANAVPATPQQDGYLWPVLKASDYSEFVFSGSGDHNVLRRSGLSDYLPLGGAGGVGTVLLGRRDAITLTRHFARSAYRSGSPLRFLFRRPTIGGPSSAVKILRQAGSRILPFHAGTLAAHIIGSAAVAGSGYDIGHFDVTPIDVNGFQYEPSRITVEVNLR